MQPNQPNPVDQNNPQPVAPQQPAGADGQPHPQVVYVTRPMNPVAPHISEEAQRRHDESKQKYPNLNISKGEYVISAAKRHPIGLFQIWGFVVLILGLLAGLAIFAASGQVESSASAFVPAAEASTPILTLVLLFISPLVLIGGIIGTYVYTANTFYLTNESVIQNVQTGLFTKQEQTVSLENIEDASFTQNGILPHILNYGAIRLSTEGDETTYRFNYTARPKQQIELLNNAVEAFKNGRPVEG